MIVGNIHARAVDFRPTILVCKGLITFLAWREVAFERYRGNLQTVNGRHTHIKVPQKHAFSTFHDILKYFRPACDFSCSGWIIRKPIKKYFSNLLYVFNKYRVKSITIKLNNDLHIKFRERVDGGAIYCNNYKCVWQKLTADDETRLNDKKYISLVGLICKRKSIQNWLECDAYK